MGFLLGHAFCTLEISRILQKVNEGLAGGSRVCVLTEQDDLRWIPSTHVQSKPGCVSH